MTREEIRAAINARPLTDFVNLTKSKGGLYCCPICHSGEGRNGTGALKLFPDNRVQCYANNCFSEKGQDTLGAIRALRNCTENEAFSFCGYTVGDRASGNISFTGKKPRQEAPEADYTAFFEAAHANIKGTDYPQRRGLTAVTVERFKLGYVEKWTHPKAPNAPASPRLIIPTGRGSYLARDTRKEVPQEQQGYTKSKVGHIKTFNARALTSAAKPVFVVEGEIDALSIIEVGGEAVALGTTARAAAFLNELKENPPKLPLVIALDNDNAGKEAAETLIAGLKALELPFYRANISGNYKDANEALQKDRAALSASVQRAETEAESIQSEAEEAHKAEYLKNCAENYIQDFIDGIADSVNTPYTPTGFNALDSVLDGGLYEGLYIVGAVTSLGKTTFVMNITDSIAKQGRDVLYISLEMARAELIAKSVSRHTLEIIVENGGNTANAKTVRGILTGARYKHYNKVELETIRGAIERYKGYAGHIFIQEGIGDINVTSIVDTVKQHIKYTGNLPVVVVDYLQILAPYNERYSDKQNTDKAVIELKRLSRDCKIPVIAISSLNRDNYNAKISLQAFKESGGIEYGSDVVIGLQPKGVGLANFDIDTAKRKNPREIEAVILKNRNGETGGAIEYRYYTMFNLFEEVGKIDRTPKELPYNDDDEPPKRRSRRGKKKLEPDESGLVYSSESPPASDSDDIEI